MMMLGTVGAFGFPDFHPPEVLSLYRGAGARVIQAYRNRLKSIAAQEILAVCGDLGLTVDSLHGHFGDDLDPSSEDESIRHATMQACESEAEYCKALGGKMVVVHPSPAHVEPGNLDRRWAQLKKSFENLARIGERLDVAFGIENMPPYHPVGADVRSLVAAIDDCGSDFLQFVLDTGHAHMTCGIARAIVEAGHSIRHTHVHDNDGANDSHCLPGHGTLPWDECAKGLHTAGYDGVFMLEVFEPTADLRLMLDDGWKRRIGAILTGAN